MKLAKILLVVVTMLTLAMPATACPRARAHAALALAFATADVSADASGVVPASAVEPVASRPSPREPETVPAGQVIYYRSISGQIVAYPASCPGGNCYRR